MNARQRRKPFRQGTDKDILTRLEAKTDLILDRCGHMERQSVLLGAVSGALAGGIMSVCIAYAKALFGVR
ncbi:MAG: hypothetical protein RRY20_08895 [Bilophila sp.]